MKPRKNLLYWPKNTYVNAASTDLRETFKRIRREQQRAQQPATVIPLRKQP